MNVHQECLHCGKKISATETTCPFCGKDPERITRKSSTVKSHIFGGVFIVVLLMAIIAVTYYLFEAAKIRASEREERLNRCFPASAQQLQAIRDGIKDVQASNDIKTAYAVKSNDFDEVYFVAAKLYGPNMDDGEGPGVWAISGSPENIGLTLSANSFAREFSLYLDGSKTTADVSMTNDGARIAEECAKKNP